MIRDLYHRYEESMEMPLHLMQHPVIDFGLLLLSSVIRRSYRYALGA